MKESSLAHTLKLNVSKIPHTRVQRIENACDPGTPDLYLIHNGNSAWVELKHLPSWPKRATTPVKLDHFTPQQRLWLRKEGQAGGRAWMFLQVEDDYLLYRWDVVQEIGTLTTAQMLSRAYWGCRKPCNWAEWLRVVVGG